MSTDYQIPGRVPEDGVPRQAVSDYWRERFPSEPYYDNNQFFDDYEPAYQLGHRTRADDMIRAYEEVEAELQARWAQEHGWDESTALRQAHLDKGVPRGA